MGRLTKARTALRIIGAAAAILGITCLALGQMSMAPAQPAATTPVELLTRRINDATPDAAQIARGQYLVAAGDCMSCHLREGGEPFAGGLGL